MTQPREPETQSSVWITAQQDAHRQRLGRYTPASMRHPGKMLPAIARHAITHYTGPEELVIDPMCGIGTSLVEAIHAGRHAIGVEYEPHWVRTARANIDRAIEAGAAGSAVAVTGDARCLQELVGPDVAGKAALVLTSPPYGPSTHGHVRASNVTGRPGVTKHNADYSRDRTNLAHRTHDELLAVLVTILSHCAAVLRPGGFVVITARPYRRHGALIDLPTDVITAAEDAGLEMFERCVALLAGLRDGQFIPRPSFFQMANIRTAREQGSLEHLIVHEDVLILRKPLEMVAHSDSPGAGCRDYACSYTESDSMPSAA